MSTHLSQKPYLSTDEAVEYLSLPNRNALYQRMKRQTIQPWCYSRLGRSLRFMRSALDQLLQADERERAALRLVKGQRG